MVKEKRILSYFIGWLVIGFIICFLGISNVFAETITPTTGFKSQIGTLMTNNEIYWNTSDNYNSNLYFGTGPTYSTYGIPAYMRLVTITDVSTNYSYKISYNMTIFTPYSSTSTWDSTKIDNNYNLMVGDDLGVIKESKCTVSNTDVVNGNSGVYTTKSISCVITINQNQNNVWLSSGYFCKNCNLSSLETLGYVPQDSYMYITSPTLERFNDNSNIIIDQNQTIIDQNNKTNEELGNLNDNLNQSTEDLKDAISESNKETQDTIIESNKETQEVIKDQYNDCKTINSDSILLEGYRLSGIGGTVTNNTTGVTDYIPINKNSKLQIKNNSAGYVSCFYDNNKNNISCFQNGNIQINTNIEIPNNASYFRATIYIESGLPIFELCNNKLDETNDKLDNLTGAITDSSTPNLDSLENSIGWLPPGPVDSILNLPLTMLNSLTNSLSKTCNPLSIKLPFVNKNIQIPCLNSIFAQITGVNELWTWVGAISSVLILYNYLLNLYAWVDKVLTLRAEFDEAMGADLANWGRL